MVPVLIVCLPCVTGDEAAVLGQDTGDTKPYTQWFTLLDCPCLTHGAIPCQTQTEPRFRRFRCNYYPWVAVFNMDLQSVPLGHLGTRPVWVALLLD